MSLKHKLLELTAAVAMLFIIFVVVFTCFHAINVYPKIYEANDMLQKEASAVWTNICNEKPIETPYVNCRKARDDKQSNIRSVAIEQTILHILDDAAWAASMGCVSGTQCSYILSKAIDTILSSTLLLFACLVLVVLSMAHQFVSVSNALRSIPVNKPVVQPNIPRTAISVSDVDPHSKNPIQSVRDWVRKDTLRTALPLPNISRMKTPVT